MIEEYTGEDRISAQTEWPEQRNPGETAKDERKSQ